MNYTEASVSNTELTLKFKDGVIVDIENDNKIFIGDNEEHFYNSLICNVVVYQMLKGVKGIKRPPLKAEMADPNSNVIDTINIAKGIVIAVENTPLSAVKVYAYITDGVSIDDYLILMSETIENMEYDIEDEMDEDLFLNFLETTACEYQALDKNEYEHVMEAIHMSDYERKYGCTITGLSRNTKKKKEPEKSPELIKHNALRARNAAISNGELAIYCENDDTYDAMIELFKKGNIITSTISREMCRYLKYVYVDDSGVARVKFNFRDTPCDGYTTLKAK